ncbi:MAG: uncharacterized protein K0Q48_2542 [Bacillota bacterium]|nr:uncharacterized protein [Bacillota bacterium]
MSNRNRLSERGEQRNMDGDLMLNQYYEAVVRNLETVFKTQSSNLSAAADLIFEALQNGGRFLVTGTGHSHMFAEEFYARAGGFAQVTPILPGEFMLHEHPLKSTEVERIEAYAGVIMKLYKISAGDVLIIASNSGRNGLTVELARLAGESGANVIAFTNPRRPAFETSRHSSRKYLHEYADLVIDSGTEPGDAAVLIPGIELPMGATSTIIGAYVAQSISILLAEKYHENHLIPPVFKSSNIEEGDEWNRKLFAQYCGV